MVDQSLPLVAQQQLQAYSLQLWHHEQHSSESSSGLPVGRLSACRAYLDMLTNAAIPLKRSTKMSATGAGTYSCFEEHGRRRQHGQSPALLGSTGPLLANGRAVE